jgi:hypothetical protein
MELQGLLSKVFVDASAQQRKGVAEELMEQSSGQIDTLIAQLYERLWLADYEGLYQGWFHLYSTYEAFEDPNLSVTTKAWIDSLSLLQCKILAHGLCQVFGKEQL